jgi:hypothetical protein
MNKIQAFREAHPDIYVWLLEARKTIPFAASMWNSAAGWGRLTEAQLIACRKWMRKL